MCFEFAEEVYRFRYCRFALGAAFALYRSVALTSASVPNLNMPSVIVTRSGVEGALLSEGEGCLAGVTLHGSPDPVAAVG
jgi:hypothetical protein